MKCTFLDQKKTKNHTIEYSFSRSELIEALGELGTATALDMLGDFLESQEE